MTPPAPNMISPVQYKVGLSPVVPKLIRKMGTSRIIKVNPSMNILLIITSLHYIYIIEQNSSSTNKNGHTNGPRQRLSQDITLFPNYTCSTGTQYDISRGNGITQGSACTLCTYDCGLFKGLYSSYGFHLQRSK